MRERGRKKERKKEERDKKKDCAYIMRKWIYSLSRALCLSIASLRPGGSGGGWGIAYLSALFAKVGWSFRLPPFQSSLSAACCYRSASDASTYTWHASTTTFPRQSLMDTWDNIRHRLLLFPLLNESQSNSSRSNWENAMMHTHKLVTQVSFSLLTFIAELYVSEMPKFLKVDFCSVESKEEGDSPRRTFAYCKLFYWE